MVAIHCCNKNMEDSIALFAPAYNVFVVIYNYNQQYNTKLIFIGYMTVLFVHDLKKCLYRISFTDNNCYTQLYS